MSENIILQNKWSVVSLAALIFSSIQSCSQIFILPMSLNSGYEKQIISIFYAQEASRQQAAGTRRLKVELKARAFNQKIFWHATHQLDFFEVIYSKTLTNPRLIQLYVTL